MSNSLSLDYQDDTARKKTFSRVAKASFIGNFVEWFDYASYGYLASEIAGNFFPNQKSSTALLSTFAIFAISFLVRPLGGLFWGHIGDRYGRKSSLSVSILLMSLSTFCIGCLPDYQAIGVLAPILLLLLRVFQGFSASGEYAGASVFLAEYSPENRTGFYCSLVPASTAVGLLVGSLFAAGGHSLLSPEQMSSWAWRIPFLIAGPLGLAGRYIRLKIEESPVFIEMESSLNTCNKERPRPFYSLFCHHKRSLLVGVGVVCLNAMGFYLILSYMPTYLAKDIGIDSAAANWAATVSLITYVGLIFITGKLSDMFGRRILLTASSVFFMILSYALFSSLHSGQSIYVILLIEIIFGAMLALNDGSLPSFLSEIFPVSVRYSGFAFSFNLSNALFGGTAPFIATWLIEKTGTVLVPAWMIVVSGGISLIAVLLSKK